MSLNLKHFSECSGLTEIYPKNNFDCAFSQDWLIGLATALASTQWTYDKLFDSFAFYSKGEPIPLNLEAEHLKEMLIEQESYDNPRCFTPSVLTQNHYQIAISVKDVVNLTKVVKSFQEIIKLISHDAAAKGFGADYINQHPISFMFSCQIANLTKTCLKTTNIDEYAKTYCLCRERAELEMFA